jgi:hypothetical protein
LIIKQLYNTCKNEPTQNSLLLLLQGNIITLLSTKNILTIFLMGIFISHELSRPLVLADYLINLEKYKQACINKAKPKLMCNGKCQVMKKMNGGKETKDTDTPPQKPTGQFHVLSSKSYYPELLKITPSSKPLFGFYDVNYALEHIPSIFRPPAFA